MSVPEPSHYTDHVLRAPPYHSDYELVCTWLKYCKHMDNYFFLNFRIVWPCIAKIAYEWNQQMHCKFPVFINGTIALHVSGSFSAHHQERYQPYDGFGTILCSSVTDCCQEQDGVQWNITWQKKCLVGCPLLLIMYLLCVYKCMYVIATKYFFPLHRCIFRWNYVQSSRYSAAAVFIIANRLHVSAPVYSVTHSLPVVIIRHIVCSLWIGMEKCETNKRSVDMKLM